MKKEILKSIGAFGIRIIDEEITLDEFRKNASP